MGASNPVPREENPFIQSYHEAQLPYYPGTRFTDLSEQVSYVRARSVPPPQITHEQAQLLEKINQNYCIAKYTILTIVYSYMEFLCQDVHLHGNVRCAFVIRSRANECYYVGWLDAIVYIVCMSQFINVLVYILSMYVCHVHDIHTT